MVQATMMVFLVCLASQRAEVKLNSQTQENVRNLFDSVSRNDRRGTIEKRNIIQKEAEQEQQTFNLMKRELRFAQRRNYLTRYKRNDLGQNIAGSKQDGKNEESTGTDRFTEERRKELPEGSDFRHLIESNMIYVDKTDIIHEMIETELHVTLTRPPRFGKSLLVSTLRYLFEGGPSNAELFKGTKIKEIFGYDFPEYTVLQLDFSKLQSKTIDTFDESLHQLVGRLLIERGINEQGCDPKEGVKHCMDVLLRTLQRKTGRRNVVLIDEYDNPWRNFQGNKKDRDIMLDIMREFFKILKSNDRNLRFCFVTGSTKIALADTSGGYNCATDISWFEEYETVVGFSQDELRTYFNGYIKAQATNKKVSEDEIYRLLDSHFKGYRFSLEDKNMYNPVDVLDFLRNMEAKNITSYHVKTDSKFVVEAIRKLPEITMVLNFMAEDDMIPVDVAFLRGFKESFNAPKAVLKVLYETGYLSVKKHESFGLYDPDKYYIGFTNQVAREHYLKLSKDVIDDLEIGLVGEYDLGYQEALKQRNMPLFLKKITAHFQGVPSLLVPRETKVTESLYQLVLYYGLLLSGMRANWESILYTERLDVSAKTDNTSYIFALKRKDNPEWMDTMEWCNLYTWKECFHNRPIVCIGIVFEDKPTESKRVIHAWGMFEKSSDGSFLPDRNSLELNKYEAKKCDRCAKDFTNESEFIQHLKETHKSDFEFIKNNLICPYCWKPFRNRGGLGQHIKWCNKKHSSIPNI